MLVHEFPLLAVLSLSGHRISRYLTDRFLRGTGRWSTAGATDRKRSVSAVRISAAKPTFVARPGLLSPDSGVRIC